MNSEAFKELSEYYSEFIKKFSLSSEFRKDPDRFKKYHLTFSFEKDFILLDFSKNKFDDKILQSLIKLAEAAQLKQHITKMFSGEIVNFTEKRSVLHIALRNVENVPIMVKNCDVMKEVNGALEKMGKFVDGVLEGTITGYTDKKFTDLVNIGIGGSDLGPVMVTEALKPYGSGLKPHFVSNIDGTHLAEVLKTVNPETTLFIIASKTFTTIETLTNATTAKEWFLERAKNPAAIARNFIAVSTNEKLVSEFGIDVKNMFIFWDWVGGRYSLWSSIGISIALNIGMKNFKELLKGAHLMDMHFKNQPFEKNLPVIFALIGILNNNLEKRESNPIFPYDQYLHRFPAYIQQADMESNGKSASRDGHKISNYQTGPIIWGEPGTNGQHAFYQLLHQGTRRVACDFICPIKTHNPLRNKLHHNILFSNFVAQTEAMMVGKSAESVKQELTVQKMSAKEIEENIPHRIFDGERPSTSILLSEISPLTLGALVSLYEHKIFVQGIIWEINSFDQFGVELGKQLSTKILEEIKQKKIIHEHDCSTTGLLKIYMESS